MSPRILSCIVVCLLWGGGLAVVQAYVPWLFPWMIGVHVGCLATSILDLEKKFDRILTILESRP